MRVRVRVRVRTLVTVVLLAALAACSAGPTDEPARPATSSGASSLPAAPDPAGDGVLRLLFLGNSHTARHDVPGTVARLLRSARPGARVVAVREPTYLHLQERAQHRPTLDLLRARPWDYVVLQAQDYSLSGRYTYPTTGAQALVRRVRAVGAHPVLFAEWARRGVDETRRIVATYEQVAAAEPACIPPVPEAFDEALRADPAAVLHAPDGNHASAQGVFLASAVLAGALLERPVVDAPPVPGLPDDVQRRLRDVAAHALAGASPARACRAQPRW